MILLVCKLPNAHADSDSESISSYQINKEYVQLNVDLQDYQLASEYQSQIKHKNAESPVLTTTTGKIVGKFSIENLRNEKISGKPFSKEIMSAAQSASLDPALVHAVIYVESRYQHRAISPKGAIGLMQLMPTTAAHYGINDAGRSAKDNLKAGTLYLKYLMGKFNNNLSLVLAAYNAGEGAVEKYSWQIPPYQETRQYVTKVTRKYNALRNTEPVDYISNKNGAQSNSVPSEIIGSEYQKDTRHSLSDNGFSPNY
jgi:soluble lytic murein transglycosylase-like protein